VGAVRQPGVIRVDVRDLAGVSEARERARQLGEPLGPVFAESAALVVSELGTNQVRYAGGGRVALRRIVRDGVAGLEIEAEDDGPGISDVERAIAGELGRDGSLGVGLAAVRRAAVELDVDTRRGEGTQLRARLFASAVRRRPTVAVVGAGLAGESRSGDTAGSWRSEAFLSVMLCDGLGHGPLARAPADAALEIAAGMPGLTPGEVVAACGRGLRGSRGAVLAFVRGDDAGGVEVAGLGNIQVGFCTTGRVERVALGPGFAGAPPRPARTSSVTSHRPTWVLATDGVRDPFALCANAGALPPWALAQRILAAGHREHDDAMVVVVR